MKPETLLIAMGQIEEEWVVAAAPGQAQTQPRRAARWVALAACAACLGLALLGRSILMVPGNTPSPPTQDMPSTGDHSPSSAIPDSSQEPADDGGDHTTAVQPDLPLIALPQDFMGGMGFEGYGAYHIQELVNGNPWTESLALETLPVFTNPLYEEGAVTDYTAMEALLQELAGRLGLDPDALAVTRTEALAGFPASAEVSAAAEGITIEVNAALEAEISFDPELPLPDGCHFTYDASYEDMETVAAYLLQQYGELLDMASPRRNLQGGDYDIYRRQKYELSFYEGTGDPTSQILQYNFGRVTFFCGNGGGLSSLRGFRPVPTEKLGDYPLLSVEEAEALLEEGHYLTTVPLEMPGLSYVAKVELIYRAGSSEPTYLPYYRFYVELPGWERLEPDGSVATDGIKTYGAYYVPAVDSAYLEALPVWDGSFNN